MCLLRANFNSYLDMTSARSRDALRQLDQFWSMLDDLSDNDPAAYRSFIDKQMKEGAEYNSPPEIHTSLRTEILVGFCRIHVLASVFSFQTNAGVFNQRRVPGARAVVGGIRKSIASFIYCYFYLKRKNAFLVKL